MKRFHLISMLCAALCSVITLSSHASLIGVLPATPGGTDWQAYYDDQLDITWITNADANSLATWDDQVAWAAGLTIGGVSGWRLPSMDVNGNDIVVDCFSSTQSECTDNEYGHLFYYGAGATFGSGITSTSPGPFSNIRTFEYWSGTELASNTNGAWSFLLNLPATGPQPAPLNQLVQGKGSVQFAWAVHSGNVNAVPVPAAVWLFGSGLIGLLGLVRRKH